MAKFALRSDSFEIRMRLSAGEFSFDRHLLSLMGQAIGDVVLFYEVTAFDKIVFIACAVLRGLDSLDGENEVFVARLADIKFFEISAASESSSASENASFMRLPKERFEEILTEVSGARLDGFSLPDQHAIIFERDVPSLETYGAVYELALERANYTCAFTGQVFERFADIHPDLNVVAIRPLGDGGSLHTSNFLVLSNGVMEAFDRGHITVGDDHAVIANLTVVNLELLGTLNPSGRLILSSNRDFWPDADQLAYHRHHIFVGRLA